MKKTVCNITACALTLLVLLSTFSFTVKKHYCGDFLVDVSFSGDADSCGMNMKKISTKKNCCKDEIHHLQGQDELQKHTIDNFDVSQQQFVIAFYISYKDLFLKKESQKNKYTFFYPPDIPKNYQVLYQSFLI